MDNILIGKRIKEARTLRNMTLDDIADDVGIAKSTVQRYEAGKITKPKIPVIQAIANSLNVNPVWLCGHDAPMILQEEKLASSSGYYFNEETAKMAQELFENKDMRVLFSAARGSTPDSLKSAAVFLAAMKEKEGYNGDDPA